MEGRAQTDASAPRDVDLELEAEIRELETARINGLRADSDEATARALERLYALRAKA